MSSIERRACARRITASGEPIARMRIRTGQELTVVDLSDAGALVEGTVRLLPGTRIDVHVMTRGGRVLTRTRVIRARVSDLAADRVTYQAALAFDAPVDSS